MKISDSGNIYEFNAAGVLEKYDENVEGTPDCMVGVVSGGALSGAARKAIEASCEKLKLGECAWIVLEGSAGAGASSPTSDALTGKELWVLVEGLDPAVLIAADKQAAEALAQAYGCKVPVGGRSRIFGRTCVAFASFESLLQTPEDKQLAWKLLKELDI